MAYKVIFIPILALKEEALLLTSSNNSRFELMLLGWEWRRSEKNLFQGICNELS